MNKPNHAGSPANPTIPNGSGAAAVLAAGIGAFALAVLAVAGDKSALVKTSLNLYPPTGPLSGVTSVAVLLWVLTWAILDWRWRSRSVAMRPVNVAALVLLGLSLLMTFPPIVDLF
jgi:hypothetical protein